MSRSNKWTGVLKALAVFFLDFLFVPGVYYVLNAAGVPLYDETQASAFLPQVLAQTMLLSAFPIGLFCFLRLRLKERFSEAMGLQLRGSQLRLIAGILVGILVLMAALGTRRSGDAVTALFSLFYFVFAVGFAEEFVFRAVCPYYLRSCSWYVQYLLPSVLFALIHIFARTGFQPLTPELLLLFFRGHFLNLVAAGCCLQLLKNYTGSLWIPILIHAIVDFQGILF